MDLMITLSIVLSCIDEEAASKVPLYGFVSSGHPILIDDDANYHIYTCVLSPDTYWSP